MDRIVKQMLAAANKAYSNGEQKLDEALPSGERGDTLADFIAIEITEVCEGNDPNDLIHIALRALDSASRQLQSVIKAIENLELEER